ncbi:MAG: hydantoinase/oxoprolinase family protein [Anaerofustis stercorihominis]|nr:hydantoinase/oxoprolinase family protein [Anaerofustis stercorihominis]
MTEKRHIALGIDTGGTYTDAVLYNYEDRVVLSKAKSVTTHEDLTIGISAVLDKIDKDILNEACLVSLSTTLATNACVENKGGKVKLILIGCYPELFERNCSKYGISSTSDFEFIDAEITIDGVINKAPDWEAFDEIVRKSERQYDSYAVVSLWGMKNPELELTAKERIQAIADKPVVCGHELSTSLDIIKRACSAMLNARLLPVIADFIRAVKQILAERNIDVPIFIVRSDGSIMTAEFALDKPVETLLCGPAASVLGGMYLADVEDGLLIDMGGTTSDIALIRHGAPILTPSGAVVGDFKTAVNSLQVNTVGLGGDTLVTVDRYGGVHLGVRRVRPICDLATQFPEVVTSLWYTSSDNRFYYILNDNYDTEQLSERAAILYEALKKERWLSGNSLEKYVRESYMANIAIEELENLGIVLRSGLTPTDVMMVRGDYDLWDSRPAMLILEHYAKQFETTVEAYCDEIYDQVKERMFCSLAKMLFEQDEDKYFAQKEIDARIEQFFHNCYYKQTIESDRVLDYSIKCNVPIIGVGAPIHLFLPDVAKALGSEAIMNEYSPVANALGAAVCKIRVTETANIKIGKKYQIFTRLRNYASSRYEDAVEIAKREASKIAYDEAVSRGAVDPVVKVSVLEKKAGKKKEMIHIETVVSATAECEMYATI